MKHKIKIISGGQTGADQGALQAAHSLNIPTGGYAPFNYNTELGHISFTHASPYSFNSSYQILNCAIFTSSLKQRVLIILCALSSVITASF